MKNVFKILFSCFFIVLAILYIVSEWLNDRIDTIFIALILIAILPWIAKYIKSLEAFGIKTELVSLDKKETIEEELQTINNNENMNSLQKSNNDSAKVYENTNSIYEAVDTVEKLVLLRHEIEKSLIKICKKNCIEFKSKGIKHLTEILRNKKVLENNVANVILDLLPILNEAVHSHIDDIKVSDADWIVETGISLIRYLDVIGEEQNKI